VYEKDADLRAEFFAVAGIGRGAAR
jgi:hypothetical protein